MLKIILLTILLTFSLVLVYQRPKYEKENENGGDQTTDDIPSSEKGTFLKDAKVKANLTEYSCNKPKFPEVCFDSKLNVDFCCEKCKDDFTLYRELLKSS